jgi:hypothetical protein
MPTRTIPEGGYIVVRQETRDGAVVYVLHTATGTDQHRLPHVKKPPSTPLLLAERHSVRESPTIDESHDLCYSGGSP